MQVNWGLWRSVIFAGWIFSFLFCFWNRKVHDLFARLSRWTSLQHLVFSLPFMEWCLLRLCFPTNTGNIVLGNRDFDAGYLEYRNSDTRTNEKKKIGRCFMQKCTQESQFQPRLQPQPTANSTQHNTIQHNTTKPSHR